MTRTRLATLAAAALAMATAATACARPLAAPTDGSVGRADAAPTPAAVEPPADAAPAPAPPDAAPPDAAPPDATPTASPRPRPRPTRCAAPAGSCCDRDGRIVRAHCSPTDNGPRRGPDGFCQGCTLRCLPPTARIATPDGERAISELRAGDVVWTVDAQGQRRAAPLVRVSAIRAPATHTVRRVFLADGRVVRASAGHPDASGRELGSLAPGDVLDGARVRRVEVVPLDGDATWDLLPEGPTGHYFADGVRLGSTLR